MHACIHTYIHTYIIYVLCICLLICSAGRPSCRSAAAALERHRLPDAVGTIYIYIYIYIYIHTYICISLSIYIYMERDIYIYIYVLNISKSTNICNIHKLIKHTLATHRQKYHHRLPDCVGTKWVFNRAMQF